MPLKQVQIPFTNSLQARMIMAYFSFQRWINPPKDVLDVAKARKDNASLSSMMSMAPDAACRTVNAGGVKAEWLNPAGTDPQKVIFYLHGGGYVLGTIDGYRYMVHEMARQAGMNALMVDYRLAPEAPFPAAVDDAKAAYLWLLQQGTAPQNVVFAGDSAGGGLLLVLMTALRDAGQPLPAGGACLCPWTDLTMSGESMGQNAKKDLMLDDRLLENFARYYLGEGDRREPLASPLYGDLSGLPPLLIQVGTHEILLSDSLRLAEKAAAAGVEVTLEKWEACQHDWQVAVKFLPESQMAVEHLAAYIRGLATR
ncbi:MAG TPA: alpha/beta hydrolase [Anaerolineaceae bacterium]|nr:alpha/beta hydrolase [Anaerolineaceae bacterium]HPN54051.1 alpha/beta hydrolase [Anaerolineaceae bacterium]